jgi:hypothetical protein
MFKFLKIECLDPVSFKHLRWRNILPTKNQKSEAILEREGRQLLRLQVLLDVIFALILWRIFQLLPDVSGPGD